MLQLFIHTSVDGCLHFREIVFSWGWFCSPGDIGDVWKHFLFLWWGGLALLLEFSELSPEMLLTILQSTEKPPTTKNYPIQHVNSTEVKKP